MGARARLILAALTGGVALAGCSPAPMLERLPTSLGGLPAGAPERPTVSQRFPAVHDLPPPRGTTTLTDEQQLKLEQDLQALRDEQESKAAADAQADLTAAAKAAVDNADAANKAGAADKP